MSKNIDKTNSRVSKGLVIFSTTMSLDGFIAGPNDDMDWIFKYNYPEIIIKQIIDSTGALVVGRRTYNVGKKDPDKPTGKALRELGMGHNLFLLITFLLMNQIGLLHLLRGISGKSLIRHYKLLKAKTYSFWALTLPNNVLNKVFSTKFLFSLFLCY